MRSAPPVAFTYANLLPPGAPRKSRAAPEFRASALGLDGGTLAVTEDGIGVVQQ
jgi:hypothetical protein